MIKRNKLSSIIIKKYPNRRLYNTQISSYISLADLFELIKQGVDFTVIDSKSKEDLTRTILIQIIFEQEAKGYNLLPISFLKQVINCYQTPYNAALEKPIKIFEEFSRNNAEMIENSFNLFYKSFNLEKKDKNE